MKHGKPCTVKVYDSMRDGTLKGGCHGKCKNQSVDLSRFAPEANSHITAALRQSYLELARAEFPAPVGGR